MAKGLNFEIHIGSQLQRDIDRYKQELQRLFQSVQGRTITIGVDNQLTQLVNSLVQSFRDINKQQVDSIQSLKTVTQMLQDQQRTLNNSLSISQRNQENTAKEIQLQNELAQAKARANSASPNGAHAGQPISFASLNELKSAMKAYQDEVDKVVAHIRSSINDMMKGIDVSAATAAFRQAISDLSNLIKPVAEAMAQLRSEGNSAAKTFREIFSITEQLNKSLGQLRTAQQGAATTATTNANAQKNEANATNESSNAATRGTQTKRQLSTASQSAGQSARRLAEIQGELSSAFDKANSQARSQSQVLGDLKGMMAQYLSVYAVKQYATEMANITGELEMQRKSLEVILGSGTAASEMYVQLRDLSQRSPYTFEDLLKSHRQLAAFGIEAKDIYGTMKSLTDIGAGLDVDVSRLILAYGHTRSYGYLSGIQNRQFETAGIDLVGALSDMYNRRADAARMNGQSAEYRSRKDIFALMRKREIPFEDVQEVIMDLDKPGGKFYNMQERQYETLGGKLRNLNNNYRIMMSEIGTSTHGTLTGVVDMLNEVTEHWNKYAKILVGIVSAVGAVKLAHLAMGRAVVAQIGAAATANRQISVRNLSTELLNSTYGSGSSSQNRRLNRSASKEVVLSIANNENLSLLQKQRIALTRQLTAVQRAQLLVSTGVGYQSAIHIANLSTMRRGFLSLRLAIMQATTALKGFGAAFLSSLPMMGIQLAVGAIASLWARTKEQAAAAKQFAEEFKNDSKTNAQTARDLLQGYADRGLISRTTSSVFNAEGQRIDSNKIKLSVDKNGRFDLNQNVLAEVEELKQKLQVLSPFYEGDLLDIDKMQTQEGKFEEVVGKIEQIRKANEAQKIISNRLAEADKSLGGVFSDTGTQNITDYVEALEKVRRDFDNISSNRTGAFFVSDKDLIDIDNATKGALTSIKNGEGLGTMREALRAYYAQIAKMSFQERQKAISSLSKVRLYGGMNAGGLYGTTYQSSGGLNSQRDKMVDDVRSLAQTLGYAVADNLANDPKAALYTLMNSINKFTANVSDPATRQEIVNVFVEQLSQKYMPTLTNGKDQLNMGQLLAEAIAKDKFGELISNMKAGVSQKDADKAFEEYFKQISSFIKSNNLQFEELGKDAGRKYFRGLFDNRIAALTNEESWKRRARQRLTIDTSLILQLGKTDNFYDFADEVKKKLKEQRDNIQKMVPHVMTLRTRLGLNFDISASMSVAELDKTIKKMRDRISGKGAIKPETMAMYTELIKGLEDLRKNIVGEKQGSDYLKSEGVKDDDAEKREKKAEQARRKREAAERKLHQQQQRQDNDDLRRFSDRLNALNKARQMYENWYNKYQDRDYALAMVRSKMTEAMANNEFVKGSINESDFAKLDSLPAMRGLFVQLLDAIKKWRPRLDESKDRRNSLLVNVASGLDQNDLKEADKNIKSFSDTIKKATDELGSAYDAFKSLRDKTGNTDLALRVATLSISNPEASAGQGWNERLRGLYGIVVDTFKSMGLPAFTPADMRQLAGLTGDNLKGEISARISNSMTQRQGESDADFKKRQEDMLNRGEGLAAVVEQFNTALKNFVRSAQDAVAELFTSGNLLRTRRDRYENSYNENEKYINQAPGLTDSERAYLRNRNDFLFNPANPNGAVAVELNPEIAQMKAAPSTMSRERVKKLGEQYLKAYDDAFRKGFISAEERSKASDVVTAAMRSRNEAIGNSVLGQMSFMGGLFFNPKENEAGLKAMRDSYTQQIAAEQLKPGGGDEDLIKVLHAIVAAIENLLSGRGNRASIGTVVRGVQSVMRWESLSAGQRAQRGRSAKEQVGEESNKDLSPLKKATQTLSNVMNVFTRDLQKASQAVNLLSSVMDNLGLGNSGLGQTLSDAGDMIGGIMSGMQAGSTFGPWGAAAGAALGLAGSIGSLHDKHLQKQIEKMQTDISKIEGYSSVIAKAQERTLGYDNGNLIRNYQNDYLARNYLTLDKNGMPTVKNSEGAAGKEMLKYYQSAGAYGENGYEQQYNMLIAERDKYVKMYNLEAQKKNTSQASLDETQKKIAELDDRIRYFAEDTAKTVADIDLKGWAEQFGDALVTAFENGEDAAEAFEKTTTSILQSLTKKLITTGVMEPLFNQLRDRLFGYADSKNVWHEGSFDINDPQGSMKAWMGDINEALGPSGYVYNGIEASQALWNGMEDFVNQYGNTLYSNDSSNMSSSIKGITEQTADLLASYVNAIRADVSMIRDFDIVSVSGYMSQMSALAEAQVQQQRQIAQNTLRNAIAAETIVTSNADMLSLFQAVINGTKQINARVS